MEIETESVDGTEGKLLYVCNKLTAVKLILKHRSKESGLTFESSPTLLMHVL